MKVDMERNVIDFIDKSMFYNYQYNIDIALIDNKSIHEYTSSDYELKRKASCEHSRIYQVASLSKTATAIGVIKLCEMGKLNLDIPVTRYIPEIMSQMNKKYRHLVTTRMLLSHSSGMNVRGFPGMLKDLSKSTKDDTVNYTKNLLNIIDIKFRPGKKYRYSGGGYYILQLLVEELSGMFFSEFMKLYVFIPLGMINSSFDRRDIQGDEMLESYSFFGGKLKELYYYEMAAAGLYSTAEDISKLLGVFYESYLGKELLGQTYIKEITKKKLLNSQVGLGCFVTNSPKHGRIIAHLGHNRGWSCSYTYFAHHKKGVVILTNSDRGKLLINEMNRHIIHLLIENDKASDRKKRIPYKNYFYKSVTSMSYTIAYYAYKGLFKIRLKM